ncbi:MAG TPA: S8 family serine peptidase, partial [Miltoncostaeaceae bacterium]|nr:S8 family serine peptidase [Miltoncostaeaceae bacterium]
TTAVRTDDPLAAGQTHLAQIGWTPASTGRPPVVAVLDTGVDASAPDLRGAVLPTSRSFAPGSPDPRADLEGHGTHVAGLIAARSGNGIGVAGMAPVPVLAVKVADSTGEAGTSAVVRGIRYALARRARIINISFGGGSFSAVEQEAIDEAARRGALVVVAAGNGGRRAREFPGAYRQVLTVAAVDGRGRPLVSSTSGPQVALAAPGEAVLSTLPGGRYGQLTGTSMAAALVSGAAARVWQERPSLQASQVARILTGSARDVHTPGRDDATGAGLLDLRAALRAPAPPRDTAEPNDEPRQARRTRPLLAAGARTGVVRGVAGDWRDPRDGYRVVLRAGEGVDARLRGPAAADLDLRLWRPGTPAPRRSRAFTRAWLAASSFGPASTERLTFTAPRGGVYVLEVEGLGGPAAPYRLTVARTRG